ncbi:hypothetical protein HNP24_001809 [Chryseobacterium sediminis]|uniref:Peptidase C14 caspase domain-containing protein n=1 Tax=Chryseobacterium sediminis TaxID=1679494 RepID=A0ABR6Q2V5_9FLAO|nr:caspase family protein [Chryseobacterium sediminis]MBB6330859.1 hypothetical protein [Chryseobacterium sediminis]
MSKLAVCIGVDKVAGFTPLNGASLGAKQFSEWASDHEYKVKVFTDENNTVVRSSTIYEFIELSINSMEFSQIIVYFSGHGISRAPNQEFWLLSQSGTNPNEFINVTMSFDCAGTCNIPYVLFISDACRSLPTSFNQTAGGQTIFPLMDSYTSNVVDIFYATRPGAPAFEVAGDNLKDSYGIFTESLIDYLNGTYLDTIANYDEYDGSHIKSILSKYYDPLKLKSDINYKSLRKPTHKWIISAAEVQLRLKQLVEDRAFGITKGQSPEFKVYNHEKEYPLSIFSDQQGKELVLNAHENIHEEEAGYEGDADGDGDDGGSTGGFSKPGVPVVPIDVNPIFELKDFSKNLWKNRFDQNLISIEVNNKKENNILVSDQLFSEIEYSGRTAIIVRGIKAEAFFIQNGKRIQINQDLIEIPDEYNSTQSSGLLVLRDGRSIPVSIISGFIGELIFKDGYLFTVNYTPTKQNTYTYQDFQSKKDMIMKKRNYIAIAANNGFNYNEAFEKIDFDTIENYDSPGSFLRIGKSLDPSLSLYAAYAFRESGNWGKINSVYDYISRDTEAVIFDVAMLAARLSNNKATAAFCPVMSAGWAYSHLFKNYLDTRLIEASNYLEPGLWTTFGHRGTDIILLEFLNK